MYIQNILPVILQLLSAGNTKQPARHENTQNTQSSRGNQQTRPTSQALKSEQTYQSRQSHNTAQGRHTSARGEPNPAHQMVFIPLPLKSDLFPEAKFYKQVSGEEDKNRGDQEDKDQDRLAFGLKTHSLGELYFLINRQENTLSVKCAAAGKETAEILNNEFHLLQEKLRESGWENVYCACLHIENPASFTGIPLKGFIDLKI